MMNRVVTCLLVVSLAGVISGCPLVPSETAIELVNSGSSEVEVTLYIGSSQYTTKDLLRLFGDEVEQTLRSGETITITRDCDDLQAVFIDNARANLLGGLGPEDESNLLLDGRDFGCGDRIRFTFSYTLVPPRLDIVVSYPR